MGGDESSSIMGGGGGGGANDDDDDMASFMRCAVSANESEWNGPISSSTGGAGAMGSIIIIGGGERPPTKALYCAAYASSSSPIIIIIVTLVVVLLLVVVVVVSWIKATAAWHCRITRIIVAHIGSSSKRHSEVIIVCVRERGRETHTQRDNIKKGRCYNESKTTIPCISLL